MIPDSSVRPLQSVGRSETVLEAKRDLLEWGVRADGELQEQVAKSMTAIKLGVKALIPWATLGATGISLLLRLVKGRGAGAAKQPAKRSLLGTVIRGAIDLWPIVSAMMRVRK